MRKTLILLFVFIMILPVVINPIQVSAQQSNDEETQNLTSEEEREAVEIIQKVVTSFKEKHDYNELVEELFVSDYKARLSIEQRRNPIFEQQDGVPFFADEDDLRNIYIEVANFYSMLTILLHTAQKPPQSEDDKDSKIRLRDFLPANQIDELKQDSIMRRYLLSSGVFDEKDFVGDEDENESLNDDENFQIRDASTLRGISKSLNKINDYLRQHLTKLYRDQIAQKQPNSDIQKSVESTENEDKDYDLDLIVVGNNEASSFFGLPDGTRLVCVKIYSLSLHFDLVRINGKLQILSIAPFID